MANAFKRKIKRPFFRNILSLALVFLIPFIVEVRPIVEEQFYGTTNLEYDNFATQSFNARPILLSKQYIGIIKTDSFVKCLHFCAVDPKCHGFVRTMKNEHTFCFLLAHDRCADPSKTFVYTEGVRTYDLRPKSDPLLPLTCQQRCLLDINVNTSICAAEASAGTTQATCLSTGPPANSSTDCSNSPIKPECHKCGRKNCCGIRCEVCPRLCWELPAIADGEVSTLLWPNRSPRESTCVGHWQRINKETTRAAIFSAGDIELPSDSKLWLKLTVVYASEEELVSYFDAINIQDVMSLSVGNYMGGSAGNFWEAPFSNRAFGIVPKSNCMSFYYPPGNCSAAGVLSYEEQIEANANGTIYRGLSWVSECRPDFEDKRVTQILYFVSLNQTALQEMKDRANSTEPCDLT